MVEHAVVELTSAPAGFFCICYMNLFYCFASEDHNNRCVMLQKHHLGNLYLMQGRSNRKELQDLLVAHCCQFFPFVEEFNGNFSFSSASQTNSRSK